MKDSLENKILAVLQDSPERVFSYGDFAALGTSGACRISLKRLCDTGRVERLFCGIYRLATKSPLQAAELARAIARKFNWIIREREMPELPPTSCRYFSSGPYRKYDICGIHLEFQHTTMRNIMGGQSEARKKLHRLSQRVKAHLPASLIRQIHRLIPQEMRDSLKDDIEFVVSMNLALKDAITGGKKK